MFNLGTIDEVWIKIDKKHKGLKKMVIFAIVKF